MKKNIFTLFIISLFCVYEGFSQDLRNDFNFGIKAGFNRANVYDTEGDGFAADPKYGFAGGLFFQLPLGKVIGIQPEILYSERGFKGEQTITGEEYSYTRNMGYLDVPVLLQIKPAEWFYIVLGPQYSLLLHRNDKFSTNDFVLEGKEAIEDQDLDRNTVAATAGFDINISNFVISGRAGWDLRRNVGSENSFSPRYKNSWLQGTLGLRF